MPVRLRFITFLCVWAGSLVFAVFGPFMGDLLPTENVMQILWFALMLFAFGGGLFIPLSPAEPHPPDDRAVQVAIRSEHPRARSADRNRLDGWSLVNVSFPGSPSLSAARSDGGGRTPRGSEEPGRRGHPVRVVQDAGRTGDAWVLPSFKPSSPAWSSRSPSFRRRHEGHRPRWTRTICARQHRWGAQ